MCTNNVEVAVQQLPGFVLRNIHNHYLIVPIKTHLDGHVLNTNEVGAFVWNQLKNVSKVSEIIGKVANRYGDQQSLEKDVLACIDEFLHLGLIQKV